MTTHFLEMAIHMTGSFHMTTSLTGNMSCAHLILMSINRSVSHGSSESCDRTRLSKKISPLHKQLLHSIITAEICPDDQALTGRTSWLELANCRARPKSSI